MYNEIVAKVLSRRGFLLLELDCLTWHSVLYLWLQSQGYRFRVQTDYEYLIQRVYPTPPSRL